MNRDLMTQLDAYFTEVDEGQGPVTVDQVTDMLERVRELPAPAPVRFRQRPKVWVAATAAAMVVVAVGLVPLLVGSQDTNTAPATEATVATTAPTTTIPSTAAARAQGAIFDFAEHNLCEWFTPGEIRSFVADAYQAEGLTYAIPPELVADYGYVARAYAFADWGCKWGPAGAVDSKNLATFDLTFTGMSEEVAENEEPIARRPADWGVDDLLPDGVVLLDPFDAPNFYVASRDQRLLVGHIPAAPVDVVDDSEFEAWIRNGVSPWLQSTDRQRVQARILNSMLDGMNWLPDTGN